MARLLVLYYWGNMFYFSVKSDIFELKYVGVGRHCPQDPGFSVVFTTFLKMRTIAVSSRTV